VARVAGESFELDATRVEHALAGLDPEPIREHYVVVGSRRYPPKQVLAAVTRLDRADFTTHQARSILRRLGFGVHRRHASTSSLATIGAPQAFAQVTEGESCEEDVGRSVRRRATHR
jgi:hypothetical protein